MSNHDIFCHFCGKGRSEVFCLTAGPTAMICDECVLLTVGIIIETARTQAKEAATPVNLPKVFELD